MRSDTDWWMHSENIIFTAEYLVGKGADGATILDLFQFPWGFDEEYEEAVDAAVNHMMDNS